MFSYVIEFIKSPSFSPTSDKRVAANLLLRCVGLYLLWIIPVIILVSLTVVIAKQFGFEPSFHNSMSLLKNVYGNYFFLTGSLLIPILEETAFRLGLSFKKHHVSIGIAALFFFFARSFVEAGNQWISLSVLLALAIIVAFVLYRYVKQSLLSKWQEEYGKITVYIVSFLFVFLHVFNHGPLYLQYALVYIILLLPTLLLVIFITFLRMRVGFFAGVLFHILLNTCGLLLSF